MQEDTMQYIETWKQVMGTVSPETAALATCARPEEIRTAVSAYRRHAEDLLCTIGAELRHDEIWGPRGLTCREIRQALQGLPKATIIGRLRVMTRIRVVKVHIKTAVWTIRHEAGLACYHHDLLDSMTAARAAVYDRTGFVMVEDLVVVPRRVSRSDAKTAVCACLKGLKVDDIV